MRDRLIDLIEKVKLCDRNDCVNCLTCKYEEIADHLLANGVVILDKPTPEIVLKVIELRNKGYKVADIAKKLCYSERQIYRYLAKVR